MDIDAALERMRQICRDHPDANFAITFEAIDAWLTAGGPKPRDWQEQ